LARKTNRTAENGSPALQPNGRNDDFRVRCAAMSRKAGLGPPTARGSWSRPSARSGWPHR